MSSFHFVSYEYHDGTASFCYRDDEREYREEVRFATGEYTPDSEVLDRALFLAFIIIGTSYYKTSPTRAVVIEPGTIDAWQAHFFSQIYQEGLSQFAYENKLERAQLAQFQASADQVPSGVSYDGKGILSLQSGGKDSLLVAAILKSKKIDYTPWYVSSGMMHPAVLDQIGSPLTVATRLIDHEHLREAEQAGGLNGHVPVTYIVMALAVVQAILLGKQNIVAAIAHEGEEPHVWMGDMAVNHQWSKTWHAEQMFADYIVRYVSKDIHVGSPLRSMSELRVAELFIKYAWDDFGQEFSSCNRANYGQGADNTTLAWCGNCPKCANSYLLFAPFIEQRELNKRLGGNLFASDELTDVFKGLLGVDRHMKPFECVGEVAELRQAYHMSQLSGYTKLAFEVPPSSFDKDMQYDSQKWATQLLV